MVQRDWMMRNLLTLCIFLLAFGANAQLVWSPDEPIGVGTSDMTEITVDIQVTNTGTTEETFFWQVEQKDGPAPWQIVVCDNNLCYSPGILACPCNDPNVLAAGATMTFMVKIKPKDTAGEGVVQLKVTTDCEGSDLLFETPVDFTVEMVSSVNDESIITDMNVYPNPAIDYFQLSNDDKVATIAIFSIVGQEIERFDHFPNQAYSVNNLNNGLYLVRTYDVDGNLLKAIRLSKR